jgi:uncharacterized protein
MATKRIRVAALTATPVKGLRIAARSRVMLERGGVHNDRRFYIVDDRGRMVNGKHLGALNEVGADLDDEDRLTLTFPDGAVVAGRVEQGETLNTTFHSQPRQARSLLGAYSSALSEHTGQPLRLVAPNDGASAVDRSERGTVTLMSRASLSYLASTAREGEIDARRFRMSIEIEGSDPFEEDRWIERQLRIGGATILVRGHVGRCIVTSRHPETGKVDLPTLDLLRSFRAGAPTSEPLAFGLYGSVLRPGVVSVGDGVEIL